VLVSKKTNAAASAMVEPNAQVDTSHVRPNQLYRCHNPPQTRSSLPETTVSVRGLPLTHPKNATSLFSRGELGPNNNKEQTAQQHALLSDDTGSGTAGHISA